MLHKSQILLICLIGILTGVFARSFYIWPEKIGYFVAVPILLIIFWKNTYAKVAGYVLLAFYFGALYYSFRLERITPENIAYYNNTTVEITGRVKSEVERRTSGQIVVLSITSMSGHELKQIHGNVMLRQPLYPEIHYGDVMRLTCRLIKPEPIDGFLYDRYLAITHVYTICDWPKIHEHKTEQKLTFVGTILKFKNAILRRINIILPEPHASLLAGLLVGSRQGIPDELNEEFKRTGLSHIVAISGYNITIIASCIINATKRHLGRKKSFWLVIGVLVVFVILTGAQASVVRAAVMGTIVLLARYLGRNTNMQIIISLAACIMAMINPLVLAFDIGFQLSFLATIGLVYLSRNIERFVGWLPQIFSIREAICSTLSATIMTLPVLLYYFGRFSIISPLANVLILPVIPFVMAFGFISVTAGIVWSILGQGTGVIPWFGLEYMLRTIHLLSKINHASIENIQITPLFVWLAYACFIVLGFGKQLYRIRPKNT